MKNVITILMCAFCLSGIIAQNPDGPGSTIPQLTPQIQTLYAQQRELKTSGDVAGLATNRQAIIAAWQTIDPTIASEFKPNQVDDTKQFSLETVLKKPNITYNNSVWGDDLQLIVTLLMVLI